MTMSECPNRKACDRCHNQKLSCKRFGEEPCERCVRLKTECKSSPSLRYRKQQAPPATTTLAADTHTELEGGSAEGGNGGARQAGDGGGAHGPGGGGGEVDEPGDQGGGCRRGGARSPKRKRKESGKCSVPPDFASINIDGAGGFGSQGSSGVVTHEPVLDMTGFGFGYDHSALFPTHDLGQHLSEVHPLTLDHFIPGDRLVTETWNHQLPFHSSVNNTLTFNSHHIQNVLPSQGLNLSTSIQKPLVTSSHKKPADRLRGITKAATKSKSRQIILKSTPSSSQRNPSSTHWMPRLSDINTRLFELSSILAYHLERVDGATQHGGKGSNSESKSVPFPVDEMFKLSQLFADAVQDVTQANGPSRNSSSGTHRGSSLDSMADPGSSMFILSTYVRLLDMYQKVFSCIHSKLAQLESGDGFKYWKLPDVTVGSFAVESTPSLQMSLTIQLAEEFLGQLRGAAGGLDPSTRPGQDLEKGGVDGSMFSGVVDVSFQAIRSREDSLGRQLAGLRQDLEVLLDA